MYSKNLLTAYKCRFCALPVRFTAFPVWTCLLFRALPWKVKESGRLPGIKKDTTSGLLDRLPPQEGGKVCWLSFAGDGFPFLWCLYRLISSFHHGNLIFYHRHVLRSPATTRRIFCMLAIFCRRWLSEKETPIFFNPILSPFKNCGLPAFTFSLNHSPHFRSALVVNPGRKINLFCS